MAEFNARRSEEAFAALVRQHVNLVFATALRQVGDAGAAEEITQNVFVALAQAAGKLGSHPTIAGWLHQTALNKSREWLRAELRRRRREQVAVNLETARAEGDSMWSPLVPLLDEALLKLREPDRQAVILHFMEGRTFQEVGSALGVGEDAARKRVNRCLDQLTDFFRRRGFAVPALAAGAPLFALSSHAAPAGLAAAATTAGLAAAPAPAATSTLSLVKGALKIMAWTKAKTAAAVGVAAILTATSTTVVGIKLAEARHATSNTTMILSPTLENLTADIQPDGTIRYQATVEETNVSSRTTGIDYLNSGATETVSRITDEAGRPMKFIRRPGSNACLLTLPRPVPPGGHVSYNVEGVATGMVKSNAAGQCEIGFSDHRGNERDLRLIEVWRLPSGATLLETGPDMDATTNVDRVELRIDKVIAPKGSLAVYCRYQLAATSD